MEGLSRTPLTLDQDVTLLRLLVDNGHNPLLDGIGLNVVDPVYEDLGLNNGVKSSLLVDTGVVKGGPCITLLMLQSLGLAMLMRKTVYQLTNWDQRM